VIQQEMRQEGQAATLNDEQPTQLHDKHGQRLLLRCAHRTQTTTNAVAEARLLYRPYAVAVLLIAWTPHAPCTPQLPC
jgi:hypothetical protein